MGPSLTFPSGRSYGTALGRKPDDPPGSTGTGEGRLREVDGFVQMCPRMGPRTVFGHLVDCGDRCAASQSSVDTNLLRV